MLLIRKRMRGSQHW